MSAYPLRQYNTRVKCRCLWRAICWRVAKTRQPRSLGFNTCENRKTSEMLFTQFFYIVKFFFKLDIKKKFFFNSSNRQLAKPIIKCGPKKDYLCKFYFTNDTKIWAITDRSATIQRNNSPDDLIKYKPPGDGIVRVSSII